MQKNKKIPIETKISHTKPPRDHILSRFGRLKNIFFALFGSMIAVSNVIWFVKYIGETFRCKY